MKKEKYILKTLLALLTVFAMAACSTEDMDNAANGGKGNSLFSVADFPNSFNEGGSTRAVIGTAEAGKTDWEEGDSIFVKCEAFDGYSNGACTGDVQAVYTYILRYTSSKWTVSLTNGNTTLWSQYGGMRISAYYAPNYNFNADGTLTLKTGKTAGTAEYLTYTTQMAVADMSSAKPISFTRNYARIRIHAPKGLKALTLKEFYLGFVPAEGVKTALDYTTTVDNCSNAFFYGTWNASNATFNAIAKDGDNQYILSKQKGAGKYGYFCPGEASVAGRGYVIDVYPTSYKSMGAGTITDPFLILTKEQMVDLLDTNYKDAFYYDATDNEGKPYYRLCCDIDMEGYTLTNEKGWFEGIFDGGFHTISNYQHQSEEYWGLFPGVKGDFDASNTDGYGIPVKDGQLGTYGIIRDLIVEARLTSGELTCRGLYEYAGALVGYIKGGLVLNCKSSNSKISFFTTNAHDNYSYYGGLIGVSENSFIVGCCADNVDLNANCRDINFMSAGGAPYYLGGLIGASIHSYVGHCYADGKIYTSYAIRDRWFSPNEKFNGCNGEGGIFGVIKKPSYFEQCYSRAGVFYPSDAGLSCPAGVFGGSQAVDQSPSNCYATSSVADDTHKAASYFIDWTGEGEGPSNYKNDAYFVNSAAEQHYSLLFMLNTGRLAMKNIKAQFPVDVEKSGFQFKNGKVCLKWE